jgi:enoyl-CoA hydratase
VSWTVSADAGIVRAAFSNPPMNYYTDPMLDEFAELVERWFDDGVTAVILCGEPVGQFVTHFSVEDIRRDQTNPEGPVDAPRRGRRAHSVLRRLTELPKPVIAAITGDAMGFGFELALAADIRIAQRGDYRIGLPEVRLGVIPGGSGTTRLTKLVGVGRALDMLMRGRLFTPGEAVEIGLVHDLADDVMADASLLANQLARLPRVAVAMVKKVVRQGADLPLDSALAVELEGSYRVKQSSDADASMTEFLALPINRRRDWLDSGRAGTPGAWRDIEALKGLKARYFRFVDTHAWSDLRGLFADDARFEFPGLGDFQSADDGVAAIRRALGEATTVHHGHMPEIEITGPDEARAVWAMDDLVIRSDNAPALPGYPAELQRGLHGYGHYHETYRRQAGQWLIKSLKLVRLHVSPLNLTD